MPKFTKRERLLKSREFSLVYKTGKRISSKNFMLAWVSCEKRRLGITVSKLVGKANVRNRVKRVLREFFRLNKELFPMGDCVITARKEAGTLENAEIRNELELLLGVAGFSLR